MKYVLAIILAMSASTCMAFGHHGWRRAVRQPVVVYPQQYYYTAPVVYPQYYYTPQYYVQPPVYYQYSRPYYVAPPVVRPRVYYSYPTYYYNPYYNYTY